MHPNAIEELVRQRKRKLRLPAKRNGLLVLRTRRRCSVGKPRKRRCIQLAHTYPASRPYTHNAGSGAV